MGAIIWKLVGPYIWHIGIGVISVVAIGAAGWGIHNHIWQKGYDARSAEIAAQNKEAQDEADENRARVRACRDRGGVWSQSAGQCVGP